MEKSSMFYQNPKDLRKEMTELVRECGKSIERNAEDVVGRETDWTGDIEIVIKIPVGGVASIKCTRSWNPECYWEVKE